MLHSPLSSLPLRWHVLQFATFGLAATLIPATMVTPAIANDYSRCVSGLINTGIEAPEASAACSGALHPMTVSRCVVDITTTTELDPTAVLSACSRDRRPKEVATCVSRIHRDLAVTDSAAVLSTCHRSLRPLALADCTLGLTEATDVAPEAALDTCIAAGYRPTDVAPTFVYTP